MKLLFLSDTQLGAGKNLAEDRLADQEAVLGRIAEIADERSVDVVVHCGDVFEHRHPDEDARMVVKRWVQTIATHRDLVIVAGNHDILNTSLASAVDLYDGCEFVRIPTVLDLGGASLACLPWAPVHNIMARAEVGDRGKASEQASEALVSIIRDLASQRQGDKPMILAAHWAFTGAHLPNGLSVDTLGEPVIPAEETEAFSLAACGHIHRTGWFHGDGMGARTSFHGAFYAGSPYPCSFGEPGAHGVWLIETDTMDIEFIPLASRPLITIDCDLTQDSSGEGAATDTREEGPRSPAQAHTPASPPQFADETDLIVATIFANFPLTDASVRLRYTASEEQHRRVDTQALRKLIMDAGAHKIYAIDPTIIRADRARAQGVDETLAPMEALVAWATQNDLSAEQHEKLADLLHRYTA